MLSIIDVVKLNKAKNKQRVLPVQTPLKAAASEPLPCANSLSSYSARLGPEARHKRAAWYERKGRSEWGMGGKRPVCACANICGSLQESVIDLETKSMAKKCMPSWVTC